MFRAAARSWTVCRRAFPSQRSRTCSQAACAPLRFLTRVPNATSLTLSPSVSLHHRTPKVLLPLLSSVRQLSSPADYGLPFRQPKPTSRLPWVKLTVIALTASSAPFEALIPLRVRSRDAGLPRLHGRYSIPLSPSETHHLRLGTSNPPQPPPRGELRHTLPTRRPERAARGTRSPSTGRDRTQKTTCDRLGEHQRV